MSSKLVSIDVHIPQFFFSYTEALAENEVPLSSHEEKTALTLYVCLSVNLRGWMNIVSLQVTPMLHAVVKKIAMDVEDEVTKIISKH